MKKLILIFIVSSICLFTGCVCPKSSEPKRISLTRTVRVCEYEKTVREMAKILEENPRYDANDVKTEVHGDNITITVYAELMSPYQYYRKRTYQLSKENFQLQKRISELEKELKIYKLIPINVTNGTISVDLTNVHTRVISIK